MIFLAEAIQGLAIARIEAVTRSCGEESLQSIHSFLIFLDKPAAVKEPLKRLRQDCFNDLMRLPCLIAASDVDWVIYAIQKSAHSCDQNGVQLGDYEPILRNLDTY